MLTKPDASDSFGFGITRDNSTSPSLLKVAQITSGGIADVDGRLSVGNRLLRVTAVLLSSVFSLVSK